MSKLKELRGRKVLLSFPIIDNSKSKIQVTPEVQEELDKELMKKWSSLEVYAVGSEVIDIKVGDKVYLPAGSLTHAERLEIDGHMRIMVSDLEISLIWE